MIFEELCANIFSHFEKPQSQPCETLFISPQALKAPEGDLQLQEILNHNAWAHRAARVGI